jgi:hypothetical protein
MTARVVYMGFSFFARFAMDIMERNLKQIYRRNYLCLRIILEIGITSGRPNWTSTRSIGSANLF